MKNPKLSVLIMAYNHEPYIEQAIKSVLEQKTDFEYEIVIMEDGSSDNTKEIILKYQNLYPEKIKTYQNEKNLGVKKTGRIGLESLKGKYIIILEGDDYWCNADKLQIQIDFLEKNPEFIGYAHNSMMLYDDNKTLKFHEEKPPFYTLYDLAYRKTQFHVSTVMFRHIFKNNWPKGYFDIPLDWLFYMIHARKGLIKYSPEIMSIYRYTGKGFWSSLDEYKKELFTLDKINIFNKFFNGKYHKYFFRKNSNNDKLLLKKTIKYNDFKAFFICLEYKLNYFFAKQTEILRYYLVNILELFQY